MPRRSDWPLCAGAHAGSNRVSPHVRPEGGARCVSSARRDLCGGRGAILVPTADSPGQLSLTPNKLDRFFQLSADRNLQGGPAGSSVFDEASPPPTDPTPREPGNAADWSSEILAKLFWGSAAARPPARPCLRAAYRPPPVRSLI